MISLKEAINNAVEKKQAIGHFNFSTIDGLWAIARAAINKKVSVIAGLSEGERDFVGVRQAAALLKSIRKELDIPIFLNADHTYSFDRIKEAVEAGFDSVIFDGVQLEMEENISKTAECVKWVKSVGPEIIVEGELGYIGTSSTLRDAGPGDSVIPSQNTTPEDASRFVRETNVDMFAPAVGNIHGMYSSGKDRPLDIPLVKRIRESVGVPLTLHGASGNTSAEIRAAVKNGVAIVHFNTELRVAYRKSLALSLQENPEEIAPYKYLRPAMQAMQKVVEEKIGILV
ncbi:MAG: hypothetical protein A3G59_00415 [Candidatus Taylorbacteria bacterium RIFCSPLOWO2_12_FULL_47_20]|uniref:Tagatose-bisphosphate aldolase n=2 Tax=Candidatus Tayloriibacteriota TaxID=1817919 RepID=A0A1G2P9N8_9BACT|nr:MAG: hypothetical protein A3H68_03390 [Candidatus Taylorbacteria bacterium RIFCSPLOWO2_02_FULL_46_40]OHA45035.1 MAG: hypothetical protein A3G59_00415 [Candidatus Taylorbacteria bacterium RIFCSPLOWO2_12_FULL_47_20]